MSHYENHCTRFFNYKRNYAAYLNENIFGENIPKKIRKTNSIAKPFADSSLRTQQRRTKNLIETNSPSLIKNAGSKLIDLVSPGFHKIFKTSQNLNESLISNTNKKKEFFFIHFLRSIRQ